MVKLLGKVIESLTTVGALKTFRRIRGRLKLEYYERRFGIMTSGLVRLKDLRIDDQGCQNYEPTDYEHFKSVMRHVEIRRGRDVFVDYGSGKGRILILAATYPFRRVIGVEFSRELTRIAEENVKQALPKLKCKDVELVLMDASVWQLPKDATVLYFFNPFYGDVLVRVAQNIKASLAEAPRRLLIIFMAPEHFEQEVEWQVWLVKRTDMPVGHLRCAIYESKGASG